MWHVGVSAPQLALVDVLEGLPCYGIFWLLVVVFLVSSFLKKPKTKQQTTTKACLGDNIPFQNNILVTLPLAQDT